jgi:adenylate kinase family enzyme
MQRVMIVGQPGSGKSTLARALGRRIDLPVFHMDHIHWQPGWVERPKAEKIRLANAVEAQERWIFEGGLSATYQSRLERADTVIWLDLPVGLRLWRVMKRTLRHLGQARPDLPEGCPEGFHRETLPFWHYIWRTRLSGRQRIVALLAGAQPHVTVIHLCRASEARAFLAGVPAG